MNLREQLSGVLYSRSNVSDKPCATLSVDFESAQLDNEVKKYNMEIWRKIKNTVTLRL